MEVRNEMPEEVKNEMVDGKKRVVTVPLPDKIKKILIDKKQKKQKLLQRYVQVSFTGTRAQRELQEIFKQMEDIDRSIGDRIQEGAKKLRLTRQKDRQWRFDNRDSFIGVLNPKPPVEKKK